jgi:hypothetical protein
VKSCRTASATSRFLSERVLLPRNVPEVYRRSSRGPNPTGGKHLGEQNAS